MGEGAERGGGCGKREGGRDLHHVEQHVMPDERLLRRHQQIHNVPAMSSISSPDGSVCVCVCARARAWYW